MSKHIGNAVDPWERARQAGRGRRALVSSTTTPRRGCPTASHAKAGRRDDSASTWARCGTPTPSSSLYADIDQLRPEGASARPRPSCTLMDQLGPLHACNSLVHERGRATWTNTRSPRPPARMTDFVDELSNWYVRRSRERFWGKGMAGDKEAAFATLYHVLETLSQPDRAVYAVHGREHVSATSSAPVDKDAPDVRPPDATSRSADEALHRHRAGRCTCAICWRSSSSAAAAAATADLKVRQPLSRMYRQGGATLPQDLCALAEDELNVKDAVFTDDTTAFMTYQLKPQMRTLGKKYGKLLKARSARSSPRWTATRSSRALRRASCSALSWRARWSSWKRTTCSPRR